MSVGFNLTEFQNDLKTKRTTDGLLVWCQVRRKWLVQTREELVRQLLIHFLRKKKKYPLSLIQVEKRVIAHGRERRFDLLCYADANTPLLLVECKAPEIKISSEALEQAAIYNYTLQVPYLLITNGITIFCCNIDHKNQSFSRLDDIPIWSPPSIVGNFV